MNVSSMPEHRWVYRGRLDRVIDGDSLVIEIDAGFGIWLHRGNEGAHIRLLGVDTPERNESGWSVARQFTTDWMSFAASSGLTWPLLLETSKADSFGRYLADVYRFIDGRCLNDDLLDAGLATVRTLRLDEETQ